MHEVLVNRLGGLSLPRKSVVRLTDRRGMTLDVYRGGKTTLQQQQPKPPRNTRTTMKLPERPRNMCVCRNFLPVLSISCGILCKET